MSRLWDVDGLSLDKAILDFTVGEDPTFDLELLPYDCIASTAHALMLEGVGLLGADDLRHLREGLREAYALATKGELKIAQEQEDGHTALEAFLVEKCGEAGKRIHTGRSRNDQVISAMRLMIRAHLCEVGEMTLKLAQSFSLLADEHRQVLMPGYTHTRQGMPSSVGQFFGAYAEGLIRAVEFIFPALGIAHRSSLGSASGYGASLPLDREMTAKFLQLECADINTIYIQNTRGQLEATALFAFHQISLVLSRMAADLIWFSSEAFGFFSLPTELTTGSSIMPQKRNPDLFELMRAVPSSMLGRYSEVSGLLHGLPCGYHRDLQRVKGPYLRGVAEMRSVLVVMQHAAEKVVVNADACEASLGVDIYATDHAYAKVRAGVPFREAYRQAKTEEPRALSKEDVFEPRTHLGAPGTEQGGAMRAVLRGLQGRFAPYVAAVEANQKLVM